jgi:hypothetical protein
MKKWYESGWFWLATGVGAFLLLRSKRAEAEPIIIIEKTPPPWDPAECRPVTPDLQPYIDKFKQATDMAFGAGSAGAVCVRDDPYGMTPDEKVSIDLQTFEPDVAYVNLDLDTLKTRNLSELAKAIKDQG